MPRRLHSIAVATDASSDEESDVESESENISELELWEFGLTLGVDTRSDPEASWIVREALCASVPAGWNVGFDTEGTAYYYDVDTNEISWAHPVDRIFREILSVLKNRAKPTPADQEQSSTEPRLYGAIESHLQTVQQRAKRALQQWSGPYDSNDGGGQCYYNVETGLSSLRSPVDEWRDELQLLHSLLRRSLLAKISTCRDDKATKTLSPGGSTVTPRSSCLCSSSSSGSHTPKSSATTTPHSPGYHSDFSSSSLVCSEPTRSRPHRRCQTEAHSPSCSSMSRGCIRLKPPSQSLIMGRRGTYTWGRLMQEC